MGLHEEEADRPADQRPTVAPATSAAGRRCDSGGGGEQGGAGGGGETPAGLAETQTEVPRLDPPAPYQPQGDTIDIELSEYAGYAGLIAANGGLEPNPELRLRQEARLQGAHQAERGGELVRAQRRQDGRQRDDGRRAGGVRAAVPGRRAGADRLLRGADGVIVRSDIKRINALKGKTLVATQFTEADFFIRYLAQEAGLAREHAARPRRHAGRREGQPRLRRRRRPRPATCSSPTCRSGGNRLAGCVTWAPKTTEVVDQAGGKATLLTTNRNLLIIADILIVNRGFAQDNPKMVAGLVDGLLEGNRMVRDNRPRAPRRDRQGVQVGPQAQTQAELAKVHLSNLPENLAFFRGDDRRRRQLRRDLPVGRLRLRHAS